MHESMLWLERSSQIMGRSQRQDLDVLCLPDWHVEYSLRQSTYHPSLWFVVRAPSQHLSKKVRLPDDSDLPDISVFGEHEHVAAFLVYVDDFLAAGPRDILQPLLTRLLDVWKGSNPDYLGRQPGDVDTMRFLGLDIELGPEEGTWLVHQQSYIYAFLQEMFDPECLKDRRTPGEPESFSDKPHDEPHAQKARVKHPPLQPGQDPLDHTPVLRLVGVLLWVSLRTRPDIHGRWPGSPDLLLQMKLVLVCVFDMLLSIWDGPYILLCSTNRSRILSGIATRMPVGHQKAIIVTRLSQST